MKSKDYLLCDNEYNSFNRVRGQINAILTEFEKQFRNSKFATSPEVEFVLMTVSAVAIQLIETKEVVESNDAEAIKKLIKKYIGQIVEERRADKTTK